MANLFSRTGNRLMIVIRKMKQRSILVLFIILISFHCTQGQGWDIKVLDKINSPANSADGSWRFVSNTLLPVSIATPVTMLITGIATHDKALRIKSCETGISFVVASGFTEGLKYLIRRPRPFVTYPDLITKKAAGRGYSFPSGHTAAAFATATSLSLSFPKWYVIVPSYLYASVVAFSRMYLGVHYPMDVICGAILGAGTAILTFEVGKRIK